ncbi:hypothetical protein GEMRC1_002826 [Eukaryota sp. GEM-RC1]
MKKIPVCGFFAAFALYLLSDIFFWFSSIDLFWPLTIVPPIDIWKNIDYPAELRYFTRSFEFIFVSVFFFILFKLRSKSFKESLTVPIIAALHLVYGLALILMHFTLSSSVVFIFVFAPLLLLTAPLTYYYSWKWKQVSVYLSCSLHKGKFSVVRKSFTESINSVILIQSLIRAKIVQTRFNSQKKAITQIQAATRAYLARKSFANSINSVVLIQSLIRAKIAQTRFNSQKKAITKIQAATRAYWARKSFANSINSVVLIQSLIRAKIAQTRFNSQKKAITKIQAITRDYLERKRLQNSRDVSACIIIQETIRSYLRRKRHQHGLQAISLMQQRMKLKVALFSTVVVIQQHVDNAKLEEEVLKMLSSQSSSVRRKAIEMLHALCENCSAWFCKNLLLPSKSSTIPFAVLLYDLRSDVTFGGDTQFKISAVRCVRAIANHPSLLPMLCSLNVIDILVEIVTVHCKSCEELSASCLGVLLLTACCSSCHSYWNASETASSLLKRLHLSFERKKKFALVAKKGTTSDTIVKKRLDLLLIHLSGI